MRDILGKLNFKKFITHLSDHKKRKIRKNVLDFMFSKSSANFKDAFDKKTADSFYSNKKKKQIFKLLVFIERLLINVLTRNNTYIIKNKC